MQALTMPLVDEEHPRRRRQPNLARVDVVGEWSYLGYQVRRFNHTITLLRDGEHVGKWTGADLGETMRLFVRAQEFARQEAYLSAVAERSGGFYLGNGKTLSKAQFKEVIKLLEEAGV
jgi:hypothetical protein